MPSAIWSIWVSKTILALNTFKPLWFQEQLFYSSHLLNLCGFTADTSLFELDSPDLKSVEQEASRKLLSDSPAPPQWACSVLTRRIQVDRVLLVYDVYKLACVCSILCKANVCTVLEFSKMLSRRFVRRRSRHQLGDDNFRLMWGVATGYEN